MSERLLALTVWVLHKYYCCYGVFFDLMGPRMLFDLVVGHKYYYCYGALVGSDLRVLPLSARHLRDRQHKRRTAERARSVGKTQEVVDDLLPGVRSKIVGPGEEHAVRVLMPRACFEFGAQALPLRVADVDARHVVERVEHLCCGPATEPDMIDLNPAEQLLQLCGIGVELASIRPKARGQRIPKAQHPRSLLEGMHVGRVFRRAVPNGRRDLCHWGLGWSRG
jgi:hypothetical protein